MYPLLFLSSNQLIDRLMYPGLAGRTRKDTWIHIRSSTAPPNSGLMWRKPKQHAWLIRRVLASTSINISVEENIAKPRKTPSGNSIATGRHKIYGRTDWIFRVHRLTLAGRTWKDTSIIVRSSTAPPQPGMIWRKHKQRAWLI